MVKRGDWVELRDAPNTRGIIKSVFCDTKASIHLSGDYDLTTLSLAELDAQWEPMKFEGPEPAFWIQRKTIFKPLRALYGWGFYEEDVYAEIVEAKPGWIAFYRKFTIQSKPPIFFIHPWWEFRNDFEPMKPPNAWDRVLHGDDG